jgi:galactose mutarotase-like enzyme
MTSNTLSNDQLTLEVDTLGAELHSIKKDGVEYLWQADAKFWARHAPVLFPVVGKLRNGQFRFDDKTYNLPGHGFARDHEFKLVWHDRDELTYELRESDETLLHYPWKFKLRITYKLKGNAIRARYTVKNEDQKVMYFGIGAHPAFNVPLNNEGTFEDYQLEIMPHQPRQYMPIDVATGTIDMDGAKTVDDNVYPLTRDLFAHDALVFESPQTTEVTLSNKVNDRSVKVSWSDMPFFGLWSPYPSDAPFVCIEPWCGVADEQETDGDITTKLGINELLPEAKFECEYTIEIN